ncbi:10161_t:CDS:2 [Ambispora gerdemannii]|uniref:10161_t:CDS:1 n=1 Tax=Ambispora gerdemannii TaxID=144530 RepID=A0A9N8ZQS9_9GLOM|nr:10161_t:CDS:2 [Ambispora gerdemannii]
MVSSSNNNVNEDNIDEISRLKRTIDFDTNDDGTNNDTNDKAINDDVEMIDMQKSHHSVKLNDNSADFYDRTCINVNKNNNDTLFDPETLDFTDFDGIYCDEEEEVDKNDYQAYKRYLETDYFSFVSNYSSSNDDNQSVSTITTTTTTTTTTTADDDDYLSFKTASGNVSEFVNSQYDQFLIINNNEGFSTINDDITKVPEFHFSTKSAYQSSLVEHYQKKIMGIQQQKQLQHY